MARHCKRLLQTLMDRHFGHVFNAPVDVDKYPNYRNVVDRPMDFGTIRKQIDANSYKCLDDFVTDVNLVLANARSYNSAGSLVHHMADALQVRACVCVAACCVLPSKRVTYALPC